MERERGREWAESVTGVILSANLEVEFCGGGIGCVCVGVGGGGED